MKDERERARIKRLTSDDDMRKQSRKRVFCFRRRRSSHCLFFARTRSYLNRTSARKRKLDKHIMPHIFGCEQILYYGLLVGKEADERSFFVDVSLLQRRDCVRVRACAREREEFLLLSRPSRMHGKCFLSSLARTMSFTAKLLTYGRLLSQRDRAGQAEKERERESVCVRVCACAS